MTSDRSLEDRIASSIQLLGHFVVPLYLQAARRLELVGTGFFIESDDAVVLVSAAHVLCQASDSSPLLAFQTPERAVQIGGRRHLSPIEGLDLGFIVTEDVSLPWAAVERISCREEYLLGRRTPRENRLYAVAGYPASKNRFEPSEGAIVAELHGFHASSIPDKEYAAHGLDPREHVAILLDVRRVYGPDGKRKQFPKPQGMSGSPIWELFDDREERGAGPQTFPIVGVATNYRKASRLLFGTDVEPLMEKIHEST